MRRVTRIIVLLLALTMLISVFGPAQAQPAPGKLDVMFLFDLTGSMAGADFRETAAEIKESVRDKIPDSRFGVASFADYPGYVNAVILWGPPPGAMGITYGGGGDYAWKLDQDLTADIATVDNVIAGLGIFWGADYPEDHARALLDTAGLADPAGKFPAQLVSWRADATKVIVMFTDAPPHGSTPPPGGWTWGEDPGRNVTGGDADDLDLLTHVLPELYDGDFEVVVIDYSAGDPDGPFDVPEPDDATDEEIDPVNKGILNEAAWWARKIASETHGAWFPSGHETDFPDAQIPDVEDFIANKVPPLPTPVGGYIVPVSKVELLARWVGLVALAALVALTVALVRRRRG